MAVDIVDRVRRNHALEHATITVLLQGPGLGVPLAGIATAGGFFLYGDVPTETVSTAAAEALGRLNAGEGDLAVSPYCGTNMVVAGVLTGISSALAARGSKGMARVLSVAIWAPVALVAARPLGRMVQKYCTTLAEMDGLEVTGIKTWGRGKTTIHKVNTRF